VSKKKKPKGVPPLRVEDWAWRFPYTPPPAIVKGPTTPETKFTPLLPTKERLVSRANRRLRGRRTHTGTHTSHWTEAAAQVQKAVANV